MSKSMRALPDPSGGSVFARKDPELCEDIPA
eukprot:CAMPEP_0179190826 /NCGR_PEP_ID=MMETSP0796-20121207/94767_1 /TAXON_ID=73915 /ORGANISM="Pyrodinium bahamense, Strain pbaha01" /LENGTH=30 /DNA_ID= /DNA_START= /DNA_END= /DNA_ORIENTATION=